MISGIHSSVKSISENLHVNNAQKNADQAQLFYSVSNCKYGNGNRHHYFHIVFPSEERAKFIYEKMKNFDILLAFQLIHNEIIIDPYDSSPWSIVSGTMLVTDSITSTKKIGIQMKTREEADLLFDILKTDIIDIARKNNILHFSRSIQKKDILILSLISNSNNNLHSWECDVSDKYECIKKTYQKSLVLIDDIPEMKIEPVDMKEPKPFSIWPEYSEIVAMHYYKTYKKRPLVSVFSGNKPGGDGEKGEGQEEYLLRKSNAPFVIPKKYQNGLVGGLGGIYRIRYAQVSLETVKIIDKVNITETVNIPVDFSFVVMPNLGPDRPELESPSEINNFSRKSYLEHIIILMMLQFYLARFSNNVLINGRQGCGTFGNDDRDVAGVLWAVNHMPEFRNIHVLLALGKDKLMPIDKQVGFLHEIYRDPCKDKDRMDEINTCMAELRKKVTFSPKNLSKYLVENYTKGKNIGFKISEICKRLDELPWDLPHHEPEKSAINKIKFWQTHDKNDHPHKHIILVLKDHIREGMHAGLSVEKIMENWKKMDTMNTETHELIVNKVMNEKNPVYQDEQNRVIRKSRNV